MKQWYLALIAGFVLAMFPASGSAQDPAPKKATLEDLEKTVTELKAAAKKAQDDAGTATTSGDSAWVMTSTALVMLMVPGLALFYGGMVRRKNILGTIMHSMVALSVVGVFWVAIGYSLAFGDPWLYASKQDGEMELDGKKVKIVEYKSFVGYSPELVFMRGVSPKMTLPNSTIPVYLHMLFQGMFAIITPALISGAVAERIRFKPYLLFILAWVLLVYCPLAHMVWGMDWNWKVNATANIPKVNDVDSKLEGEAKVKAEAKKKDEEKALEDYNEKHKDAMASAGKNAVGYLGAMPSIDFAGGTVVHIAAGFSSLACFLLLRKRFGYPQQVFHPNSMVLTIIGAGILWFGWFGFNGGSYSASGAGAVSAFAATQAAAAAAGLTWMLVEWIHKGKPTALGLASGIVAGLVAVTPASGYVFMHGGLIIGLLAGVICYVSVAVVKPLLGYDDTLDAFGVHGVGGFLGAVLTGYFCSSDVNSAVTDKITVVNQFKAAAISAVLAFVGAAVLVKLIDLVIGFTLTQQEETDGLDQTEHGETGFDFGLSPESSAAVSSDPKAAVVPPNGLKHFQVVVEGVPADKLMGAWSDLCKPSTNVSQEFKNVYPYITTVQGSRFKFRGGDQDKMRDSLAKLFEAQLKVPVKAKVEA